MSEWPGRSVTARSRIRHIVCFVGAGLTAFAIDAGILVLLTRGAGLSPFLARIPAIAVAMTAAWLINRTLTFRFPASPSIAEFLRYAAASAGAICVNYAVYASVLLLWPRLLPVEALVFGSAAAALVSYAGYRFFAFRTPPDTAR